ncbi:MAG: LysR family transcriptional regulator [Psychromonas sp.]|nr:LysR family transcriptional regulator [Psychromonas sp.]
MDISTLIIFYHVARLGSFAEASRQLNMPVSTVSRKIQLLEQSLNVRLLHRTTRAIQLTEQGKAIWLEAEQLQDSSDRITAIALSNNKTAKGKIKITAPQGFVNWPLADWLIEFKQEQPDIDIQLIIGNRYLDLQQERIDFAFRQGPLNDSSLIAQKVIDIDYGLFANSVLFSKKEKPSNLDDLSDFHLIGVNAEGHKIPWLLHHQGQDLKYTPQASFCVEDNDLVVKATFAGLGIGYLPILKTLTADDALTPVLKAYWPKTTQLYMVYQSREYLAKKDQLFIAFMQQKFSSLQLQTKALLQQ